MSLDARFLNVAFWGFQRDRLAFEDRWDAHIKGGGHITREWLDEYQEIMDRGRAAFGLRPIQVECDLFLEVVKTIKNAVESYEAKKTNGSP